MLPLDDPRWQTLHGGYGVPYDASIPLRRLERGEDRWSELWQELHHQGDVGEASYAAVPHLVRIAALLPRRDWNFYGLIATIEVRRHRRTNPPLPDWLIESYRDAWSRLRPLALADLRADCDPYTLKELLAVVALSNGQLKLGSLISTMDDSEISEILKRYDGTGAYFSQDGKDEE